MTAVQPEEKELRMAAEEALFDAESIDLWPNDERITVTPDGLDAFADVLLASTLSPAPGVGLRTAVDTLAEVMKEHGCVVGCDGLLEAFAAALSPTPNTRTHQERTPA